MASAPGESDDHHRRGAAPTRTWWQRYAEAEQFHTAHGHLRPPTGYTTATGFKLNQWVYEQRTRRRKGALPQDQAAALERIGMEWEPEPYAARLAATRAYAAEYGHVNVPYGYRTPDGLPLGTWINSCRTRWRIGTLNEHVHQELEKLGIDWLPTGRPRLWRSCAVPGCDQLHQRRNLCEPHFGKWRHYGDPLGPAPLPRYCPVRDCPAPAETGGWCPTHRDLVEEGHGRSRYRTRRGHCGGRCEVCRADHIRERAEQHRRRLEAELGVAARREIVARLWEGAHLDQACAEAGISPGRAWSLGRVWPEFAAALDRALEAVRDPALKHGREQTYTKHRCRCPDCRTAKARGRGRRPAGPWHEDPDG